MPQIRHWELHQLMKSWFCRDLTPFETVDHPGLKGFFGKNVKHVNLPTPETLANSALDDIYEAIRIAVMNELAGIKSICIMMDGWMDKYKARPYLGVRLAFLKDDWSYEVVMLGCHVVPSQTARAVAEHVSSL